VHCETRRVLEGNDCEDAGHRFRPSRSPTRDPSIAAPSRAVCSRASEYDWVELLRD